MAIVALNIIRKLRGESQALLITGSDTNLWVVKLQNNPQHPRVLVNEFIVGRLAREIGLSVPDTEIIEMSKWLGVSAPSAGWYGDEEGERALPRQHCGSRFASIRPGDTVDYLPNSFLAGVLNLREFAGILALDKWTCNCDGRQAVFTRGNGSKRYRAAFIDHGCCFNTGEWNFPDAPLRALYGQQNAYAGVTGWESFSPWLERIEQVDPAVVHRIARSIPSEWYGGDDGTIERLLARLLDRRKRVRDLISDARRTAPERFPHWSAKSFAVSASIQMSARKVWA